MYIHRAIENEITKRLFNKKAVIIYGPRQVGKTTLVKHIAKLYKNTKSVLYLNCDEGDIARKLSQADTSHELKSIIGNNTLIIIDEAQRVVNIGIKIKLLVDTFPHQHVLVTGSSSFELANRIKEPLTGRAWEFWLYPISIDEMNIDSPLNFSRNLEPLLIYGSYPTVFTKTGSEEKMAEIKNIVSNYLYKDIFTFQKIKYSDMLEKLLTALALQIGNEVSTSELASLVGIDKNTIERYITILEQSFVIFKLSPFSRNLRKELSRMKKIYFYDLGIRNTLVNNFNPLNLRNDTGALWENFVIAQKKKKQNFIGNVTRMYFWRTYSGSEIDLVEDKNGVLSGTEIKWQKSKKKPPIPWSQTYPRALWQSVNKDTYFELFHSNP